MTTTPALTVDRDAALELALSAERWIDTLARPTPNGRAWLVTSDDREARDLSLYRGAAGVVLFYLELAAATGDRAHLDAALAGADGILDLRSENDQGVGLYRGASGLAFVLEEAFRAGGLDRHRRAAEACIETVLERAERRGAGIGWIEPIPFADAFGLDGTTETFDVSRGSAGVALALLSAAERGLHPDALDSARAVGERLLEVATPTAAGLSWPMMLEPVDWTAPNWSHGTAGIAYCLARLHAATGDARFRDAALGGARHLCSIATVNGACRSIHHSNGRGKDLFYLGWCHGPPGTSRLFFELARQTGDAEWDAWLRGGGEAVLASGAPEQRSRGYWSNVGQCCGAAGVGEFAISLSRALGDDRYLDLARRVGAWLERQSIPAGTGCSWPQAEHRVRPELLEAQTGYMQGAAGVGSFLLRLWALESGRAVKIQLPDCPFAA
ncbi:MAG TPA: lanthionine synthetase LanC family protein [Thermoanaerobaculia bacterium]|nr:lanthionine synthetase LanC family protein [Thermoanaerobaculia bacterium]